VDGAGIRIKIKKDYEKALRDLDNSRRQLDQFHQTDLPQFTRWLNTHFGALLTEIRELSQKMAVDEELVFHVQNEVMFGGGSYARAYKRVMELRENPEPLPPPPTGSGEPDGSGIRLARDRNPETSTARRIRWRNFSTRSSTNSGCTNARGKDAPPGPDTTPSPLRRPTLPRG
jgi:hypothetical protein